MLFLSNLPAWFTQVKARTHLNTANGKTLPISFIINSGYSARSMRFKLESILTVATIKRNSTQRF